MHSVFLEFLPTLYPTNISAAYIVSAEQTEKSGKITSLQTAEYPRGGEGGTWVFFGWVCAARDSRLAPRSKKKFP